MQVTDGFFFFSSSFQHSRKTYAKDSPKHIVSEEPEGLEYVIC